MEMLPSHGQYVCEGDIVQLPRWMGVDPDELFVLWSIDHDMGTALVFGLEEPHEWVKIRSPEILKKTGRRVLVEEFGEVIADQLDSIRL